MKIGFLLPWNQDLERWTTYADEKGLDGIEILYSSHDLPVPYDFKPDVINAAFTGKNVKVCATTMFWINTIAKDPGERAQARRLNEDLIKTASAIKSPYAIMGIGNHEDGNLNKNLEEFRKEFDYLTKLGESMNVQIAFHIGHKPTFGNTIDNLKILMKEFPELKLKVDPVGVIRNVKADPYYGLQLLGSRIVHLHFKDFLRMPEYEVEPPVGLGEIKWNNIMALLYEIGYEGYVAIEPHGPKWGKIENYPDYITLSKRHIEQFLT